MNKVKIFGILAVMLFVGIAAGVVYSEYNKTADAKMTLHHDNNNGFETLVSSNDTNFSNSIVVDNVDGGDMVTLVFSHENMNPNTSKTGNITYEIECVETLTFETGECEGQILDFFDENVTGDRCDRIAGGLVYTNPFGSTVKVNLPEYITKINDNTAKITPIEHQIIVFDDIVYTTLNITFNEKACGEYTISGYVEEYTPDPTPTPTPTPNPTTSCMLTDFETGVNTDNDPNSNGYFRKNENYDPLAIDDMGAFGSNYSVRFDAAPIDCQQQTFYLANPNNKEHIEENDGCNRMEFFVLLPIGIETAKSYNFHLGTYVMPGDGNIYIDGDHYYHYYNLCGSEYWTKIIANQHPCHQTGVGEQIPDNPTAPEYNYMEGMTRFYISALENSQTNIADPWSWYIDEVRYYNETEPENTISINSISCTYMGNGHFIVRWYGENKTGNLNHYELRYSDQPIDNSNYGNALIAPGCDDLTRLVTEHGTAYSVVSAEFTIPITEGTAYFAMKDLTNTNPYCTRIDYTIFEP